MIARVLLALAVTMPILTACVGPGTSSLHYTPPTPAAVQREIEIFEPAEQVWNRLVEGVTRSSFSLRNINEMSRVVSLSFSVNAPERYVDCGTTRRDFSFRKQHESYDYALAESSSFKAASSWGARSRLASVLHYQRQTTLEGHATVHVAPRGAQSSVTANVQFHFSSSSTGEARGYSAWGRLVRTEHIARTTPGKLSFSTTQSGSADWAGVEVTCQSKGSLEAELFALALPRDGRVSSSSASPAF